MKFLFYTHSKLLILIILYISNSNGFFIDNQISNKFNLTSSEIENDSFLLFQNFKNDYNKNYPTIEEFKHRFNIFTKNLNRIKIIQESDPESEYNINLFADLSQKEFSEKYLKNSLDQNYNSENSSENSEDDKFLNTEKILSEDLPKSWDWREKNVVSEVKDQKSCGSCWAFSATQVVESHIAIKTGKLYDLSEQNLIDCDEAEFGCHGGYHYRALDYISKHGLVEEKNYPYKSKKLNCTVNENDVVAKIQGYKNITSDEVEMAKALYEIGPLAVGIDSTFLQFYFGGVSDPMFCSNINNHDVLIVGYGTSLFGKDYWIVKNSWGSGWGEKGYFRFVRGMKKCGIAKAPSVPIV